MPVWEKKITTSFSPFSQLVPPYRLCLLLRTVYPLVCVFIWLFGFLFIWLLSLWPQSSQAAILSSILWSPAQHSCLIGSWVTLTTGEGEEGRGRKEHRCLSTIQAVCPLVCWYSNKLTMAACQISQGIEYMHAPVGCVYCHLSLWCAP